MVARMHQAFDLFEAGVSLMRAKVRREHPHADDAELDRIITAWLLTRPGAEYGDAQGVALPLDRW